MKRIAFSLFVAAIALLTNACEQHTVAELPESYQAKPGEAKAAHAEAPKDAHAPAAEAKH